MFIASLPSLLPSHALCRQCGLRHRRRHRYAVASTIRACRHLALVLLLLSQCRLLTAYQAMLTSVNRTRLPLPTRTCFCCYIIIMTLSTLLTVDVVQCAYLTRPGLYHDSAYNRWRTNAGHMGKSLHLRNSTAAKFVSYKIEDGIGFFFTALALRLGKIAPVIPCFFVLFW